MNEPMLPYSLLDEATPTPSFEQKINNGYFSCDDLDDLYLTNRSMWNSTFTKRSGEFWDGMFKYAAHDLHIPVIYVEKAINRAWDEGHAQGYQEVLSCLRNLAEIFN